MAEGMAEVVRVVVGLEAGAEAAMAVPGAQAVEEISRRERGWLRPLAIPGGAA